MKRLVIIVLMYLVVFSTVICAMDRPEEIKGEVVTEEAKFFVPISDRYTAGQYLIYDCVKRHFACVSASGFEWCQKAREKSRFLDHALYACAALKKFDSFTDCVRQYYFFMHNPSSKIFCINSSELRINSDVLTRSSTVSLNHSSLLDGTTGNTK